MRVYVDTSSMAKRYFNETASDAVEAFVSASDDDFVVTPLTLTEFESVLRRRLRMGEIDKPFVRRTRDLFARDLAAGLWQVHPFDPLAFDAAARLLRDLKEPLATLDALHLASALGHACSDMVTSDRQLARAARASRMVVHEFFE